MSAVRAGRLASAAVALRTCRYAIERSHQNTGAPILRALVLRAQSWIRASTCVMGRGVARARARVCVLGRRCCGGGPILRGGRQVRIRAYRDLRRLSPSTPEPLRLQHLPCAVWASTLWEQRACVLDGAIGRGPAQVRVSGGLVRAVCSALRSSQCGSRGLHGCTSPHACGCDRQAGAGERRRLGDGASQPTAVVKPADDPRPAHFCTRRGFPCLVCAVAR